MAETGRAEAQDRTMALRLWAVVPGVAVAIGFVALFQHSGQVEYLGGACVALILAVVSALAPLEGRGSSGESVDGRAGSFGLLRLSWAPWVVMLLVGVHSVTASYDHDLRPPRNPPLHALGWLVLAATAVLAVALLAAHRRVRGAWAWTALAGVLFLTTFAGSTISALHEQDVRNTVQPCACFMP